MDLQTNIPEQEFEFYIEDGYGFKYKCKGTFWGTLVQDSSALKNYNPIELKLKSLQIEIDSSPKLGEYLKEIDDIENYLDELKTRITKLINNIKVGGGY